MKKSIEQVLGAFNTGVLGSLLVLVETLKQNEWDIESAAKYLESELKVRSLVGTKECPECSNRMYLYTVNTNNRNQVGGDYKTQWLCTCGYEKYSKSSYREELINSIRLLRPKEGDEARKAKEAIHNGAQQEALSGTKEEH